MLPPCINTVSYLHILGRLRDFPQSFSEPFECWALVALPCANLLGFAKSDQSGLVKTLEKAQWYPILPIHNHI